MTLITLEYLRAWGVFARAVELLGAVAVCGALLVRAW